ncbi:hypothetical protein KIN20_011426 [Parelaphostrongylus tenuis]|uniref:Uncharacterized protein n=1 Tax=Parelaphostrongylus tenuis TaxID=148309 RepID=A0AAD5MAW7_PARTN|nr:hypothetical protein KIN20_011426 [Parelaphostrongylus tenuis]
MGDDHDGGRILVDTDPKWYSPLADVFFTICRAKDLLQYQTIADEQQKGSPGRMGQTGPQWSLYPLLAIVALMFRCDFYLQSSCTFISFWFLFSSLMETICLADFDGTEANIKDGICYGLKYRTMDKVASCIDFLGPVQMSFLLKIGWDEKASARGKKFFSLKDRESIRFFITTSLTVLSAVHFFCTTMLMVYSAIEIKIRLYSYHYQLVVGTLVTFTGIFHFKYCCTFFFLGLPFAIGVYSIIQGVVSWRTKCHGSVSRAMNVVGVALALLMLASTVFGIFCWSQRNTIPKSLTRHCHWFPKTEAYCIRLIHFSHPYVDWLPIETEREIAVLQMITYIFLFVFSFLQFSFSMKSAFTTRLSVLYY